MAVRRTEEFVGEIVVSLRTATVLQSEVESETD
jgi:hypothetical protein